MSNPFTPVTPQEPGEDRDFFPWQRAKGKLMIVRPISYQPNGFKTQHNPDSDVLWADIALLDSLPEQYDLDNNLHKAFPAGSQFRNQAVMGGFLKGAFKRYIGQTLIGTVYLGQATKGKPPYMWQDLSGDANAVARGQSFLAARPEFLIPFTPVQPEPPAEPWATGPAPTYSQQPPQSAPAGYNGGDPWAQSAPAGYPAQQASGPPAQAPVSPPQNMSTLAQLKQANMINHQGQPQTEDPPF